MKPAKVSVSDLAIRKAAQACWGAVPFVCASEDFFYSRIKEALHDYPVLKTASINELREIVISENTFQGLRHAVNVWCENALAHEPRADE